MPARRPNKRQRPHAITPSLPRVTADQVRWFRLRKSGLAGSKFASPEDAAHALFGVQAQINSAGRLALWHRLTSPESDDADQTKLEIETSIQETKKVK